MLEVGATIGHYRILTKLGEGGMGAVYLGEHTLLGRKAAIKVLLPALSAEPSSIQRFFTEARAVSLLSDPGIVQVYDFGFHSDGSAFLVMEALDGEAMNHRLRRIRRFGVFECLRLVQLICSALEVAHGKGIVHRDLKPGNLFLIPAAAGGGGERIKILDFGIAKLSADGCAGPTTRAGALLGTPAYMSPEQCRGESNVDLRSDVYAIGCVMFTMLAGRPPFRSKLPGELIAAHLREPPPLASTLLPRLPAIIDDLLQRCLNKAPGERFPSMTALGDAIAAAERALRQDGAAALPDGPDNARDGSVLELHAAVDSTTLRGASGQSLFARLPVSPEGSRRSRRWIGLGLAVGAALLGGGAAAALSRASAPPGSASLAAPSVVDKTARSGSSPAAVPGDTVERSAPAPAPALAASPAPAPAATQAAAIAPAPAEVSPPVTRAAAGPRLASPRSPSPRRGGSPPPPKPTLPEPRPPEPRASHAPSVMPSPPTAIDPMRVDRGD